eukprot:3936013-Rhodomonas_salina.1
MERCACKHIMCLRLSDWLAVSLSVSLSVCLLACSPARLLSVCPCVCGMSLSARMSACASARNTPSALDCSRRASQTGPLGSSAILVAPHVLSARDDTQRTCRYSPEPDTSNLRNCAENGVACVCFQSEAELSCRNRRIASTDELLEVVIVLRRILGKELPVLIKHQPKRLHSRADPGHDQDTSQKRAVHIETRCKKRQNKAVEKASQKEKGVTCVGVWDGDDAMAPDVPALLMWDLYRPNGCQRRALHRMLVCSGGCYLGDIVCEAKVLAVGSAWCTSFGTPGRPPRAISAPGIAYHDCDVTTGLRPASL